MAARDSPNVNKRQQALNALRTIRYRSPAMNLVQRAQYHVREKKWDEAIGQYGLAIKLDSELTEAYTGRANIYLKLNKAAEAKKDYVKALDLDPYSSEAVTGTALCQVLEGEYEQGIKTVEDSRKKFDSDQLFSYNAACVYGRAVEYVKKNDKVPDREAKLAQYQKKAFRDLEQSVQLGFNDFKWMEEDPDLKELRELPEFKKIYNPGANALEQKLKANPPPRREANLPPGKQLRKATRVRSRAVPGNAAAPPRPDLK
jgi:tetratricopeptide (TPR) repeat protein